MSDLRIDYGGLRDLVEEGRKRFDRGRDRGERRRRLPLALARWLAIAAVVAVLPFGLLIRGGVFAYQAWGVGTWGALVLSASATALLLGGYAWVGARRFGVAGGLRTLFVRAAALIALAYVAYTLVFVASSNVKSEGVRSEYRSVHPLLRVASSALILVDPGSVITDAGRTAEDYALMGLSPNEASLHFAQADGFVHALDLRTSGRGEIRNRAVELVFWALGFHSLRHVGTADHLHVSLRLPD